MDNRKTRLTAISLLAFFSQSGFGDAPERGRVVDDKREQPGLNLLYAAIPSAAPCDCRKQAEAEQLGGRASSDRGQHE